MAWVICAIILITQSYVLGLEEFKTVDTSVGQIRGQKADDGDYYQFLGIPFGKVDTENKFGVATPYPEFDDIFDAVDDSAICPQAMGQEVGNITRTIDCLHLNIFVPPTANITNRLPVMVYIYGGGFVGGFNNKARNGPRFFMTHDVILVALNYRVGVYGFMCLDISEVPGNQGLKDQLLALRWIRKNIECFGGDINRITLFGQSAGGMSIDLQLLANKEELFHRAIIMSGSSFTPHIVRPPNPIVPLLIASRLGYNTSNVKEAISYLSSANYLDVISASNDIEYRPCRELSYDNVENFISDVPANLDVPASKGKSFLVGFTSDETIHYYAHLPENAFPEIDIFNEQIKKGFEVDKDIQNEMEQILRRFYIGDQEMSKELMFDLANFESDVTFAYPVQRSLVKLLENGADKIYYYKFSYVGERNFIRRITNITVGGALHTDDLGYMFDMESLQGVGTPDDYIFIEKYMTLWTNFAKYGDPTPVTTELLPTKWEPVVQGSVLYYMDLDSELTLSRSPFHGRFTFLDVFMKVYGKYEHGVTVGINAATLSSISLSLIVGTCFFVIGLR